MNVRYNGNRRILCNLLQCLCGFHVGNRNSGYVTPGFIKSSYLLKCSLNIRSLRIIHGLDPYGITASKKYSADVYNLSHLPVPFRKENMCVKLVYHYSDRFVHYNLDESDQTGVMPNEMQIFSNSPPGALRIALTRSFLLMPPSSRPTL